MIRKLCLLLMLIVTAGICAAAEKEWKPGAMNFWVSPGEPTGIWETTLGVKFPADMVMADIAKAGGTDIDFIIGTRGQFRYDSQIPGAICPVDSREIADQTLTAAEKYGLRVWFVLTPLAKAPTIRGDKGWCTTDPDAIEWWRRMVEEMSVRFQKKYPKTFVGFLLHEFNRPEVGNPHTEDLPQFSEFCKREFGEAYTGDKMPSGHTGELWDRRFNLYRAHCLTNFSEVLANEAKKHGLMTAFCLYDPEKHASFSAAWGYDTLAYEKLCQQLWMNPESYFTLKGAYSNVGITYRGANVPRAITMGFHGYPKSIFEYRAPLYPYAMRKYYSENKEFSRVHGDFFNNYSLKTPTVMKLFFEKENVLKWMPLMNYWYGGQSQARIGIVASSLPLILRHPVNPGAVYNRTVGMVRQALNKRYPVEMLLAGSQITLAPDRLREQFDLLIIPEEAGIGVDAAYIESLKKYVEKGGRLLALASPLTTARRDLTQEKELTQEIFGVTVKRSQVPGYLRLKKGDFEVPAGKIWTAQPEIKIQDAKVLIESSAGMPVLTAKGNAWFLGLSCQAEQEEFLAGLVGKLLPEQAIRLVGNTGFTLHAATLKNDMICLSLPAAKPAKAVLQISPKFLKGDTFEVRNILTGQMVVTGPKAKLAQGVEIKTDYPNEPYVLAVGTPEQVKIFPGIYPDNTEFSDLDHIVMIENPEVPLLVPDKPGIKVGIYSNALGAEKIYAVLRNVEGINAYLMPRLDGPCLGSTDVAVIPQPKSIYFYQNASKLLRDQVETGKGLLLIHNTVEQIPKYLPEITEEKPGKRTQLTDAVLTLHKFGKAGTEVTPGFTYDHYIFKPAAGAVVAAVNKQGEPVIITGQVKKGRVAAFGTLPGYFGSQSTGTPEGEISAAEAQLLINAVKYLGGGK